MEGRGAVRLRRARGLRGYGGQGRAVQPLCEQVRARPWCTTCTAGRLTTCTGGRLTSTCGPCKTAEATATARACGCSGASCQWVQKARLAARLLRLSRARARRPLQELPASSSAADLLLPRHGLRRAWRAWGGGAGGMGDLLLAVTFTLGTPTASHVPRRALSRGPQSRTQGAAPLTAAWHSGRGSGRAVAQWRSTRQCTRLSVNSTAPSAVPLSKRWRWAQRLAR